MSIGQRAIEEDEETDSGLAELYSALGPFDTPEMYAEPYKVNCDFDVPYGAGNAIDRKTVYIDRILYQECMDNAFKATGLNPQQIIALWCIHEHTEICISFGDNPVDDYYPSHTRALAMEHESLMACLGRGNREGKVKKYEETIWPALVRAYHRDIKKPPRDLWCAPALDEPTPRDEEILERLSRLGVADARKRGKYETHYQPGPRFCKDCRYWDPKTLSQLHGDIASCKIVSGMVRQNRHCDMFKPATKPHPDARKGNDGKYYLPDAKRPGKYLRVEKAS